MKRTGRAPAYWYGDAPVPAAARAIESVYAAATGLRRGLYRRRLLGSRHPAVPVVVVGNITAGGAGKTPLTVALVERLKAEGWQPGVASRGHGRDDAGAPRWVEPGSDPRQSGDEPLLIARRTGAKVRVDLDRAAAAGALAAAGCDIVVCDDGLQHYRLARDIEIEVIDGRRRYGNGRLLPAGPLREPPERARRCDFHVVNLPPGADAGECGFGEWPMRLVADRAWPLAGGRTCMLDALAGQRVHAVAGIGDPERFFAMLRGYGMAVVPHAFSDHHRYTPDDFAFGSRLPVLMTEKDAVKLPADGERWPSLADFYSVPVRAELPEAFWTALLDRLAGLRATA